MTTGDTTTPASANITRRKMLQSLALTTAAAAIAPVGSALAGTIPNPGQVANPSVDPDASAVQVGSVVYVGPPATGYSGAEGLQVVTSITGDILTGDTGDQFPLSSVESHLAGVIIRDGVVIDGPDDRVLIAMGQQLESLHPQAEALWAEVQLLRKPLDEALGKACQSGAIPAVTWWTVTASNPKVYAAYEKAVDRFNIEAGNLTYMLIFCINRCRARTPWGLYYRSLALSLDLRDDLFACDDTPPREAMGARELMDDARLVAEQAAPQPFVGPAASSVWSRRGGGAL